MESAVFTNRNTLAVGSKKQRSMTTLDPYLPPVYYVESCKSPVYHFAKLFRKLGPGLETTNRVDQTFCVDQAGGVPYAGYVRQTDYAPQAVCAITTASPGAVRSDTTSPIPTIPISPSQASPVTLEERHSTVIDSEAREDVSFRADSTNGSIETTENADPPTSPESRTEPQTNHHFGIRLFSAFRESNRTPAVQLTGWRVRDDDFGGQQSSVEEIVNVSGSVAAEHGLYTSGRPQRTLAPENLPRMYPEWALGIPFLFDEQLEEERKGCCGTGPFPRWTLMRWFIVVISVIGLSCVIVGVALGALTTSGGNTRLVLCLSMIGAGVVLISVSGIAWRLTPTEPNDVFSDSLCFSPFSVGGSSRRGRSGTNTTSGFHSTVPYTRVARGRSTGQYFPDIFQHADFLWRPPPPSYQTAMRERPTRNVIGNGPDSPPPTYRSRDDRGVSSISRLFNNSRPPSYTAPDPDQGIPLSIISSSSDQRPTNSSGASSGPSLPNSSAGDVIGHDDRASLVQNEGSSLVQDPVEWTNDRPTNDRLTIIDCSDPVPVGFELSSGRMRDGRSEIRPNECAHERVDRAMEILRQMYV